MAGEHERRAALLAASNTSKFLEVVYANSLTEREERDDLALELAALNNEGLVDVVAAFKNLKTISSNGPDFFLTRLVFEKTLPHLNAPVSAVMRCVLQLRRDAGEDMMAGTILDGFIGFCAKDPSRPLAAMKEIESKPDELVDMLPATIAAGSQIDTPYYLAEVIRLSQHTNIQLRRRAIFSMSQVRWPKGESVPDSAIAALEQSVANEHDDQILAGAVNSAFTLFQQDKATELRVTALIGIALAKGGENTLYAASRLFGLHTNGLPLPLLNLLLDHLKHVRPENRGTLNHIDIGIAQLLKSKPENGLRFLEDLLTVHADKLTVKVFDSVCGKIRRHNALLGKVVTRWFLRGERALCESVHEIGGEADHLINVDADELKPADLIHILFVARKAIGYFFMNPMTAASVVISLMRLAPDDEVLNELGHLLFDPLLLNYPGKMRDYVREQVAHESGKVKETIEKALVSIDAYLEVLRGVPTLPALHPGQAQQESYRRYMSDSTAKSLKAAEKQSVLLGLVTKSILLYGRTSINYVYAGSEQPRRMETPLTSHSVEMEFPRMYELDTYGVDIMLRRFRNERFRT